MLDADPDDTQLLVADRAIHQLTRRASIGFALGWVLVELSWLALAIVDRPYNIPSDEAEHLVALMFTSAGLGLAPLTELLIEAALGEVRTTLGTEVNRRGLAPERAQRSFVRPIVSTALWILLGTCLILGGAALLWNTKTARAHSVELQRSQVEHSLDRLAHGDPPLAGVEVLDAIPEALAPAAAAAAAAPDAGETLGFFDLDSGLAVAIAKLDDGRVVVSATKTTLAAGYVTVFLALLLAVGVPLFGFAFWLFGRMMIKPVETFTAATQQFIDEGRVGDLERIMAVRNDEIGQLAAGLQQTFDILADLTDAASAVSDGKLSVELDHPGPLHDAFRGMLEHLNAVVGRLRETSLELAAAAVEITTLSERQEQAALTQSSNVQQIADTVRSLAGAAAQIAEAASGVRQGAEQAEASTATSVEQISVLREHTASIAELLGSIAEIAQRSDLLALNGSLEATRAGEAGRGFALVAGEMRRLAERVAGTVDDVRVQIANIEASSEATVGATTRGRELAQRAAEVARTIDELASTQSRDTELASRGVESTAGIIVETTQALAQIRASTEGLRAHAEALELLLADFELRESRPA